VQGPALTSRYLHYHILWHLADVLVDSEGLISCSCSISLRELLNLLYVPQALLLLLLLLPPLTSLHDTHFTLVTCFC
jgi:hypothetical protein